MAGRRVGTMAGRGGSALAQRVMAIPMMAPLLVLALAVLPKVAEGTIEGFEAADTNKDGVLDKGEFAGFAQHIQSELSELMGTHLEAHAESAAKAAIAGVHVDSGMEKGSASVDFPVIGDLDSSIGFWAAFVNSLIMIIVTELGDKTFFIAAVLAMRQDRMAVYLGAVGALALMTVLSVAMGFALPALLPREYTHYMSAALFLYFGAKMLSEAKTASDGVSDELQEVEEELATDKKGDGDAEEGLTSPGKASPPTSLAAGTSGKVLTGAFTMTFLAEWGDRSQIATIAMAAAKDPYGVTVGGTLGHALCTGIAVVGGRILASRISEKAVATIAGFTFLAFAVHSFFYPDV